MSLLAPRQAPLRLLALIVGVAACAAAHAQPAPTPFDGNNIAAYGGRVSDIAWNDPRLAIRLPPDIRGWFRNPDGSCVQCSIGMCGAAQNVPEATTLLWTTDYGKKERGGSGPSRVAEYARRRGIRCYNITGDQTYDWMKWATRNHRGAAIGAASSHFQTLYGKLPDDSISYVCNNNSTGNIDEYDTQSFRRLHEASGTWIVILDYPPQPPLPVYEAWWR